MFNKFSKKNLRNELGVFVARICFILLHLDI